MSQTELTIVPEYAFARCCAIIPSGGRCKGRWQSAYPVCWVWDPVKGTGIEGPHAVLCAGHAATFERYRCQRIRVVGGWLGAANEYGYGSAVYDAETGWTPAPAWWGHKSDAVFGRNFRRDAIGDYCSACSGAQATPPKAEGRG